MDTFAHYLWTYAIARLAGIKERKTTALFGILPDLLSFGILIFMLLITGKFELGKPHTHEIPSYVYHMYDWTHSLVIFLIVMIAIYFFKKRWYLPLIGWMVHILIDIPTHTEQFFPTPFLWPISDYSFSGISWGVPWFMFLNYSCLAAVYGYFAWESRQERITGLKKQ
jgi:membrane-bound metal-dependent hydrolase YbcI (DUF457 family)